MLGEKLPGESRLVVSTCLYGLVASLAAVAFQLAIRLAAAFNSPLAAVAFVLEEIIADLNSRALGSVLLASVIGAFNQANAVLNRSAIASDSRCSTWSGDALTLAFGQPPRCNCYRSPRMKVI